MRKRKIRENIYWMGAVDWDRRMFDALVPIPNGTSYNAYLIQGSEKTVLLDTVDPEMAEILMAQLKDVPRIDYIVSHHAEQDHSGALPLVTAKYPEAQIVCTPRGREMLVEHLRIPDEKFILVKDRETLSLGDKTLEFIHAPWVHWPETMVTYLREDRILFSCDFLGMHLATSDLFARDELRACDAAKLYYAEIMMPFRGVIEKNLDKIEGCEIDIIAPSHGPMYDKPEFILKAYRKWVSAPPENIVMLPYTSMHGSTARMVHYFVGALAERNVTVRQFNLAATGIGDLAMALVDAATLVVGTPTVLAGAHPSVVYAVYLANALRPKVKFVSIIGSYGWGGKVTDQLAGMLSNLKVEILDPVFVKGMPTPENFAALDELADAIVKKHKEAGIM